MKAFFLLLVFLFLVDGRRFHSPSSPALRRILLFRVHTGVGLGGLLGGTRAIFFFQDMDV